MIWYEVVEDLGDGSSTSRRFKTKEAAEKYEQEYIDYCYSGISEVDTDSKWFWHDDGEEE
jgi:hypothetical protein